jgi:hypothetical protein
MRIKRLVLPALFAVLGLAQPASAADSKGKPAESKAAPAAKLSAEQIVDRFVTARGGLQAWRAVQTLDLSGKMEAGTGDATARALRISRGGKVSARKRAQEAEAAGKSEPTAQVELPFKMDLMRPNKSRIEIEFAGKKAIQVYDGSQGWKLRPFLNRNDVEPFTEEETRAEAARDQLGGPLIDHASKGTKVALEGVEAVQGRDAYKLKLTLKDGSVQHVWVDAQSFLDVKVEGAPRRMDGRIHNVWIYQRDFRTVGGVVLPFVMETAVDGYPSTHKATIVKAEVNPKLPASAFAKPGA